MPHYEPLFCSPWHPVPYKKACCWHPHSHHAKLGISEKDLTILEDSPKGSKRALAWLLTPAWLPSGEKIVCAHLPLLLVSDCSPIGSSSRSSNAQVSGSPPQTLFQPHPFLLSLCLVWQKLPILGMFPEQSLVLVMLASRLCCNDICRNTLLCSQEHPCCNKPKIQQKMLKKKQKFFSSQVDKCGVSELRIFYFQYFRMMLQTLKHKL